MHGRAGKRGRSAAHTVLVLAQEGINLAQLNSEPSDLDLVICTADTLHCTNMQS